jgi:hypothetical protein
MSYDLFAALGFGVWLERVPYLSYRPIAPYGTGVRGWFGK